MVTEFRQNVCFHWHENQPWIFRSLLVDEQRKSGFWLLHFLDGDIFIQFKIFWRPSRTLPKHIIPWSLHTDAAVHTLTRKSILHYQSPYLHVQPTIYKPTWKSKVTLPASWGLVEEHCFYVPALGSLHDYSASPPLRLFDLIYLYAL